MKIPSYKEMAKQFLHKGASETLVRELADHIQEEVEFWFDSELNAIEADLIRVSIDNQA